MSEGLFITKTDFNVLMKKIDFLEKWILNNSKPKTFHNWLTEMEAMELIGCKKTKLKELRRDRLLEWKYASNGSKDAEGKTRGTGIRISRTSVEAYNESLTREGIFQKPIRKN